MGWVGLPYPYPGIPPTIGGGSRAPTVRRHFNPIAIPAHHLPLPFLAHQSITDRSFRYASPRLWNQLPDSFRQPHKSCLDSPPRSRHVSTHPCHHRHSQHPSLLHSFTRGSNCYSHRDRRTYAPDVHLMTSRELTSGFDYRSRGHLRMAVSHHPTKFGADIFIQPGVTDIFPKFKMAAAAILVCAKFTYLENPPP